MQNIVISGLFIFLTALCVEQAGAAPAAASQSPEPKPYFQFEQATRIIRDCHRYSVQIENGNGTTCLELFEQLADWSYERYISGDEALQAIRDATHVREVFVPVFSLIANIDTLTSTQRIDFANVLKETLEKMGGFRGADIKFENEEQGDLFTRFIVDVMVSAAVSGVQPKTLIKELNLMSKGFEPIRVAFDIAIKSRARFLLDYASAPELKQISPERKSSFISTFLFRPLVLDLRTSSKPLYNLESTPFLQHMNWKPEAEKLVLNKPMLEILELLTENLGVKIPDNYEIADEDGTIRHETIYRLDEMGGWAVNVLDKLGLGQLCERALRTVKVQGN